MRFDWRAFCTKNNIPFVTSGPNTAKGNISIHCPFCGFADPSEHLGLSLDLARPYWGCFRSAQHRGRHPAKLVARLLGIPYGNALKLVESGAFPLDDYEQAVESLKTSTEPAQISRQLGAAEKPLCYPKEFRRLTDGTYARRFMAYLEGRGFGTDAKEVAEAYDLQYALTGDQAWRLIFPIYSELGDLVGWTGRAVQYAAKQRYMTFGGMGKDHLLGACGIPDGSVLVVCEGPVDFLKLDYYGNPHGVHAVATLGTSFTDAQVIELVSIHRRMQKTCVLYDRDTTSDSLRLAEAIETFGKGDVRAWQIPEPFKDPGEMTPDAVRKLCKDICSQGSDT